MYFIRAALSVALAQKTDKIAISRVKGDQAQPSSLKSH